MSLMNRVMALGVMLWLSGCGDKQSTWSEEVRLQGGETLVVERTAQLRANHIAGGGGGSINEGMTVEIAQPIKPDNPSRWSAKFVPILMDRDPASREWFIVATFFHCDSWYALGRPKLPYTEYRFRGGQWVQQALSPQWIGRAANVLSSNRENAPHVTLSGKERVLAIATISPEYRRVVGEWSTTC